MKIKEYDYYNETANWSFDHINYEVENYTNWDYEEEIKNSTSSDGLDFCECTNAVQGNTPTVQPIPASNIEINNTNIINKKV